MPTRTSPCLAQCPRCPTSSSKPSREWATVARPWIVPAVSTTQTSWDSAAQSMPTYIRPPFCRGAVPVTGARGGSLLTGARGASSHGRSALPEAGGGGGISLALEGRWHLALPPPVTEMLRACTLRREDRWSLTEPGWTSNGRRDHGAGPEPGPPRLPGGGRPDAGVRRGRGEAGRRVPDHGRAPGRVRRGQGLRHTAGGGGHRRGVGGAGHRGVAAGGGDAVRRGLVPGPGPGDQPRGQVPVPVAGAAGHADHGPDPVRRRDRRGRAPLREPGDVLRAHRGTEGRGPGDSA